jgi:glycosyltransferase involved in cell wall biosynthesis
MTETTIAVICHDYGRYLAEAVESAVRQTRPAEVLVIDDASRDETPAIVDRLIASHPSVRRRTLETSVGLSRVRNLAAAEAATEWIVFLDADDWLAPEYVARAESWLRRYPKIDALTTDMTVFGTVGRPGRVVRALVPRFWTDLLHRNSIVQTSFIRRRTVLDLGGYDPGLDFEDWDFWIRLLQSGRRVGRLPGPHVFRREHGLNKSKICDERAATDAIRDRHASLAT